MMTASGSPSLISGSLATEPRALSTELETELITKALLTREVESRLLRLYDEGKLSGTVHTCIGQEFSGAVVAAQLRAGDAVFSNHRCHGHYLCVTDDVDGLVAEIMGKVTGTCGGWGGSQHLCRDGFYSNGIQGGIAPISAGLAMARARRGGDGLAVVFLGDGTLGEGVVYETMTLAAKWRLPLWLVLENNGYAQSTARAETLAGGIRARAEAFGIPTAQGDTWRWQQLYHIARDQSARIRAGGGPAFLQIDTYRLKAHSKGDDTRPREEVAPYERDDPLNRLIEAGHPAVGPALAEAEQRVEAAVRAALAAENPTYLPSPKPPVKGTWHPTKVRPRGMGEALNQTFHELMAAHEQILFIGEDVRDPYGGAFKVSRGLSSAFPDRVLNTPISEAAIVGLGTGLAMEGFRPVVEIMFGDFLTLTLDQLLNHAAKFPTMYGGREVGLVVRTPMGGGRGYGPTHSQTLERHFLGIPGLRVLALNNLTEPMIALEPLLTGPREEPVLLLENKLLYGLPMRAELPDGFQRRISDEVFPTVHIAPESAHVDVTLLGYGGMADTMLTAAERLFEEHDLIAQVLCPLQIYPFDIGSLLPIIARADALVLVEEGQSFAGFGAELAAQLFEHVLRPPRLRRLGPPATAIPASAALERALLPGPEHLIQTVLEVTRAS